MYTAKRILAGVLAAMLAVALISCQPSIDGPEQNRKSPENPVKGGEIIFAGTEPKTLNPIVNTERDAFHFLKLVFEGLVDYDESLK